jgi:3D-(3,5/4)-trihydroxycyclohexane-1,2-dione acylhydrolase (decyclizing)
LGDAFARAKSSAKTYVICLKVDAYEGWTKEGHTWWEIGTPTVSNRSEIMDAHAQTERGRARQRAGV